MIMSKTTNTVDETELERLAKIEAIMGKYPDFPKKGILFRDIMPILNVPSLFRSMIELLCDRVKDLKIDRILGVESRGFLIGPVMAYNLNLPFNSIRKKGKLPGKLYSIEYELEYGKDCLEVQQNGLPKGSKCLIVDDLIATGGSLSASKKLVEMSGSDVVAFLVIIELKPLEGYKKLGTVPLMKLFSY